MLRFGGGGRFGSSRGEVWNRDSVTGLGRGGGGSRLR